MSDAMAKRILDGSIIPGMTNTAIGCYVGIQFPAGFVGVVNEISFFLDEYEPSYIEDKLTIEASSDNFVDSVVVLHTVSEEAHEGWNYYSMADLDEIPKYQYYRLKSDAAGNYGCNSIGEIHFFGFEVIDDENDEYECPVELV